MNKTRLVWTPRLCSYSQYVSIIRIFRIVVLFVHSTLPEIKLSDGCRLRRAYVREFGENVFSTDGNILFCKVCEIKVTAEKNFTVTHHMRRDKHLCALDRIKKRKLKCF